MQPDEKHLGERLVSTGKLGSEELLAALECQRQQGGPRHKRLGEILVERGHVSPLDIQETLRVSLPPQRYAQKTPAPSSASAASVDPLPDDVRQAMADPRRRVGHYVVLSKLGQGANGVVYRGYDPELRREVALKMIATENANDQVLARFMREAQACAKLRHPSIVAIHEVGEHDSQPYLVMDLVEGQTLAEAIDGESLSLRDIVSVTFDIAKALDHAHSAGIIHRDVKPANIMLSENGRAILMDFGLARDTSAQQQLTQTGQIMGTPLYMAPEQIQGDNHGPWTDVYALGAVLYHGLAGAPPFESTNPISLFGEILMKEPLSPRSRNADVNPDLATITLKCLEKEPHRRYPSAAALEQDLQRFLDGQAILARPISRTERAIRWIRCNRALSALLTLVIVLVVGGLAAGQHLTREAELEAVHREERARLLAEQAAKDRESIVLEQGASLERQHLATASLRKLREDVAAVLDRVRSGTLLEDPNSARIAHSNLLKHQEPETVRLLVSDLEALSQRLAEERWLDQGQELFLHFLCQVLADIGLAEVAVPSLGRYLNTELSLATEDRDQLRAVPAGKALCLLGGKEAERLLLEARDRFGSKDAFWGQVHPLFKLTGVEPDLEAETAWGHVRRAFARHDKGDLDGALADYTRALEIDPNLAVAWANRGRARHDRGDLEGALADYTRALEIDPNLSDAWNSHGIARHEKGDLDGALADYTRALEIDPNLAGAWCNRGIARDSKGDVAGALADYTRAIEIDPNLSDAWINRGGTRDRKGDLDGAIADYTRAIEINPNLAKAWSNRGVARDSKGDLDGAIADYTRAIEINPSYSKAWSNRGGARQRKGDLDGAIADYTRAIEINPNYASPWSNRGDARQRKGDLDGAIADWYRFLEIAPDHSMAPAVRAEIQKLRARQARAREGK